MKRSWRWMALVAVLFGVGAIAVAVLRSPRFQKWHRPPVLALPADNEVIELRASLRASPAFEVIPEFAVPAGHIPIILGKLRPAEYIREPWRLDWLDELGEVVLRTRDGGELRVRFFDGGHNPAVLTVDGVDQFYGVNEGDHGGNSFARAVRDASLVAAK